VKIATQPTPQRDPHAFSTLRLPSTGQVLTDFMATIAPESQTISQLDGAAYTLTLSPVNGFDSPVSLEVSGVPRGMRASIHPRRVALPSRVILDLVTSKWLLPATYDLTVTATGKVVGHAVVGHL